MGKMIRLCEESGYRFMVIIKAIDRLKSIVWAQNRRRICRRKANCLKNRNVSILSMNCTGGILYHDVGMQFLSPTINLYMQAEDFIRFCEHLDDYLAMDTMRECRDPEIVGDRIYPVAWLGDIKLFLVHYASVQEAQKKWNERKKRIRKDQIAVIATDRDGMSDALKERFEKLPYRKVLFTHLPDPIHPHCFYLRGYEKEASVGIITDPIGWAGKRPIDQFDWISFLNGEI